jgi:hypothetical protein
MGKCWAASLGDCSEKISGEHVISAGLFLSDKIFVQGFSWCRDAPKEIGSASFVKNILCRKHNSDLSPVDEAGIKAFRVFQECTRLQNVRQQMKPRHWKVSRFRLNGLGLERWFLKTLINIAAQGDDAIGPHSQPGEPSRDLVKIAFGLTKFESRCGLYSIGEAGESFVSEDRVSFTSFHGAERKYIAGARFFFRGHSFALLLTAPKPGEPLYFVGKDGTVLKREPLYHLRTMNFLVGGHRSHVVEISW